MSVESVSDRAGANADLKRAKRVRQNPSGDSTLSRLPPHSTEAEQGVLGCQLLAPNECVSEAVKNNLSAETYYDLRHQTIQSELFEMFDARIPIDTICMQQRLKDKGLLEQVGGVAYLAQLQDAVPSAANLSYYLEIVQEKHLLRKMLQTCTDVVCRIYNHEGEVEALLDGVEREILAIRPKHRRRIAQAVSELVDQSIVYVEGMQARKGAISGLSTGFPDLDNMMDGLHGSEETVISAFPGYGKTTIAMNIVEHVALNLHKSVGVFSLEMTARQLITRTMCSHARVNLRNINRGFLTEEDFPKLKKSAGEISKSKIFIDDTSDLTVYEIRARARSWKQEHKIELLVVDYLQLVKAPASGRNHRTPTEELAEVSLQLKQMAKELDLPVIVLSQLTDKGDGKSMLRGSANIGQDADNVLRIQNANTKNTEKRKPSEGILVHLNIQKQRNGPTGIVDLVFLKQFTRFESASKISDEDVPNEN